MPWGSVRIKPGVDVEQTPTLLEAGIAQSLLIRFRSWLVEKLGGWAKFYPFTVGGVPKALHAWSDLNNVNHLGVGTTTQLGVITSGGYQDVTPQTLQTQGPIGTGANQINFSTTINSNAVVVFDGNIANLTTLDFVFFNTPVYIPGSGITLSGLYPIVQINGTSSYQINAAMNATATVSNSGHTPIFTTTAGSNTISVEFDAHGINLANGPAQVVFPILTGPITTQNASVSAPTQLNLQGPISPSTGLVQVGMLVTGASLVANSTIASVIGSPITSGTYNNSTGLVTLNLSNGTALNNQTITISGLTGTGAFASLNGTWVGTAITSTQQTFQAPAGLGATTITGGTLTYAGIGYYTLSQTEPNISAEPMTIGFGMSIQGAYSVLTVPNANTFTINGSTQASVSGSFSMNGGQPQLLYYINLGPPASGTGYGLGPYGAGGYGTGQVPSSQVGVEIAATDWSLGNWGEILISCPKGGGIYEFDPTGGFTNAGLINGAPIFNTGAFIAMPQQQIIAFGSTIQTAIGPLQDPMEVAWCDVSNFNQWTASSTNQAGKFRLSPGSMIVGGRQGPNSALLWTDLDLWTMTYLGPPLVWGFNKVTGGAGLIGLRAHCELMGTTYWMSQSNFHSAGPSGVGILQCPVWDVVFQNLFTANDSSGLPATRKCWAWANTASSEVWWFYPSIASNSGGQMDGSYVKYNQLLQTWDYGPVNNQTIRTCGINQSVLGPPIAATNSGLIYQHEISPDADGSPLIYSYTTGYFMLAEGEDSVFVDTIYPDFKFGLFGGSTMNAAVQITINVTDDPSTPPTTFGPFSVSAATPEITDLRIRGRMMSFTFAGSDVGTFTRIGRVRYRWAPDGKHP